MKRQSQTPFLDGYRAGSADRYIGRALTVSVCSFDTEPEYVRVYSEGYRAGWYAQNTHEAKRRIEQEGDSD
jgi:hypothetical protein